MKARLPHKICIFCAILKKMFSIIKKKYVQIILFINTNFYTLRLKNSDKKIMGVSSFQMGHTAYSKFINKM